MQKKKFKSEISGKDFPINERVSIGAIRNSILSIIEKEVPEINHQGFISLSELNTYRKKYIEYSISEEIGELSDMERFVIENLKNNKNIVSKLSDDDEAVVLTFGQKLSDKVANFGGSWHFILSFLVFMAIWIILNTVILVNGKFDVYPFILLNLILSCVASLQAPLIMMSQNRQEEKDRERAKKDYIINLKSELEIRMLHEKIDHLIMNQQQDLLEIQQVQLEIMKDIMEKLEKQ